MQTETGHQARARIRREGRFTTADISVVGDTFARYSAVSETPWDDFRDSFLDLPDWFDVGMDPHSVAYAAQQHRLWAEITGVDRGYSPLADEVNGSTDIGVPVTSPGFYQRRDIDAVRFAGEQLIAFGMILKNSGLKPGDWALEYGAGYAQAALHMARVGINVDTVDISEAFCRHVRAQAQHFGVPLTAFVGEFGLNPRRERRYDLIWFYESFHHCVDFFGLIRRLRDSLSERGRVLLIGEPIVPAANRDIPYPWGIRLCAENVAVVRNRRWFELGFTEDFLVDQFMASGFVAERIECGVSQWGQGYCFRPRGQVVELEHTWIPGSHQSGWHGPEPGGRWTRGRATLAVDTSASGGNLTVMLANHHHRHHAVLLRLGNTDRRVTLPPGKSVSVPLKVRDAQGKLTITCDTCVPARDYPPGSSTDQRDLGVFVRSVAYG